ncbi:hypothetical protein [Pelagicoccus mobilis]|uniref:Transmembrane protein n=1 Tax=Pelagicoccus mobilis TaxID=415221 RepID=A0A934RWS9_9BACT|nr:hypothetical protein [Pelagicoccus mobilis]MBK1878237.1 hypothetical protein [Pelagicoccus mobilis]
MNKKSPFRIFAFCILAFFVAGSSWAASLEHGKVRARTRGWEVKDEGGVNGSNAPQTEITQEQSYVEESFAADASQATVEVEEPVVEVEEARTVKRRGKLMLIGGKKKKKGPTRLDGYLAVGVSPALRFSDLDPVHSRPPSPALPEFNFVSSEYVPYLIEEALPEDAMNDASLLSEIVIEMEPHTVVSGTIDTRRHKQEEQVEHFQLEEQRTTVLRPEEVLIFFETETASGKAGALVPFSPATPSQNTTINSKATLRKE